MMYYVPWREISNNLTDAPLWWEMSKHNIAHPHSLKNLSSDASHHCDAAIFIIPLDRHSTASFMPRPIEVQVTMTKPKRSSKRLRSTSASPSLEGSKTKKKTTSKKVVKPSSSAADASPTLAPESTPAKRQSTRVASKKGDAESTVAPAGNTPSPPAQKSAPESERDKRVSRRTALKVKEAESVSDKSTPSAPKSTEETAIAEGGLAVIPEATTDAADEALEASAAESDVSSVVETTAKPRGRPPKSVLNVTQCDLKSILPQVLLSPSKKEWAIAIHPAMLGNTTEVFPITFRCKLCLNHGALSSMGRHNHCTKYKKVRTIIFIRQVLCIAIYLFRNFREN